MRRLSRQRTYGDGRSHLRGVSLELHTPRPPHLSVPHLSSLIPGPSLSQDPIPSTPTAERHNQDDAIDHIPHTLPCTVPAAPGSRGEEDRRGQAPEAVEDRDDVYASEL